jgi:hypothetical protein
MWWSTSRKPIEPAAMWVALVEIQEGSGELKYVEG